jgi:hypothetical protein
LPASFLLVLVGIIKFIRDVIYYQNAFFIPGSTIVILLMGAQIAALGLLADVIVRRSSPINRPPISSEPSDEP